MGHDPARAGCSGTVIGLDDGPFGQLRFAKVNEFEHAGFLRLGAGIARKGWLTREDVVNTLPLDKLRKELGRKRAKLR